MAVQSKSVETEEEYIDLVEKFSTLVDKEMTRAESTPAERTRELALRLPALISLVNTVGYLRGEDGMFLDIRPRTERQGDLYENQDRFEKRLQGLLDRALNSPDANAYREKLSDYYMRARTFNAVTGKSS